MGAVKATASPPESPGTALRRDGTIAGLVSLAAGLGVAQLVSGLWRDGKSPVVAMGEWTIDHVPRGVKDWAIRTFATNDKLVLIIGTLVVLVLLSMWLGRLAQRRLRRRAGRCRRHRARRRARSRWTTSNASAASALPSLIGAAVAGGSLAWLSGWRPGWAAWRWPAQGREPGARRSGPIAAASCSPPRRSGPARSSPVGWARRCGAASRCRAPAASSCCRRPPTRR